jgi:hypothetical protein
MNDQTKPTNLGAVVSVRGIALTPTQGLAAAGTTFHQV